MIIYADRYSSTHIGSEETHFVGQDIGFLKPGVALQSLIPFQGNMLSAFESRFIYEGDTSQLDSLHSFRNLNKLSF